MNLSPPPKHPFGHHLTQLCLPPNLPEPFFPFNPTSPELLNHKKLMVGIPTTILKEPLNLGFRNPHSWSVSPEEYHRTLNEKHEFCSNLTPICSILPPNHHTILSLEEFKYLPVSKKRVQISTRKRQFRANHRYHQIQFKQDIFNLTRSSFASP